MKRKFTLNDLLQYHYNELSSIECTALEHQMQFDEKLLSDSRKIKGSMMLLDTERTSPSFSSIQFILDYDRKSSGELETC